MPHLKFSHEQRRDLPFVLLLLLLALRTLISFLGGFSTHKFFVEVSVSEIGRKEINQTGELKWLLFEVPCCCYVWPDWLEHYFFAFNYFAIDVTFTTSADSRFSFDFVGGEAFG